MREDIIKMAREAGFADGVAEIVGLEGFARFAALVAAAEREACAKLCEEYAGPFNSHRIGECAAAIRARGQDPMPLFDDWPGGWGKTIPTINGREVCIGLVRVEGSTKDRPGWVFKDTGQPVELSDLPDNKTKKHDPRMPNFAPRKNK